MIRNSLTLISTLIFSVWAHPLISQSNEVSDTLVPLSSREADAIIQKEAKAKADKKAQRRAFLLDQSKFQVVEKTEIFTGKGKMALNRVRPPLLEQPVLESKVKKTLQPKRQLSEAEIELMFLEQLQKEQRTLMLSATVYDRKLTRLQWHNEGRQHEAWSNIDFNYLRGLTEIDTKEVNYLFFLVEQSRCAAWRVVRWSLFRQIKSSGRGSASANLPGYGYNKTIQNICALLCACPQ